MSDELYLIWSTQDRAWIDNGSRGYSESIEEAIRISAAEATQVCRVAFLQGKPGKPPPFLPVRELDLMSFISTGEFGHFIPDEKPASQDLADVQNFEHMHQRPKHRPTSYPAGSGPNPDVHDSGGAMLATHRRVEFSGD